MFVDNLVVGLDNWCGVVMVCCVDKWRNCVLIGGFVSFVMTHFVICRDGLRVVAVCNVLHVVRSN